ncbi:MAG: hypothetical protein GEEBNDBF_02287 [bacterium]|nr:hypothetical protein [bacterium]
MTTWRLGLLGLLCSLWLAALACGGGGSPVNNTAQDGFEGDLKIDLERLAAVQNSRIVPIRVKFSSTNAIQDIPVWIRLGYKKRLSLSEKISNMTAAPGTPDFNRASQVFLVPPDGATFTLFWDAAADLGADAHEETVVIRAGFLRTNADDPREAVCDFQPVVQVILDEGVICSNRPPSIEGATLELLTPGEPYSQQITAEDGDAPISYRLWDPVAGAPATSNEIAPGLFLNQFTGAVTGTFTGPGNGPIEFVVQVSDVCGDDTNNEVQRASQQIVGSFERFDLGTFVIPVATTECPGAGPQIQSQSLEVEFGSQVDRQLEAAGGTGALTWALVGGELPSDLLLTSDGRITGTVDSYFSGDITVQVTDSCVPARTDTETLNISVICQDAPPVFNLPSEIPQAVIGEFYDFSFSVDFPGSFGSLEQCDGNLPPGTTADVMPAPGGQSATVRIFGVVEDPPIEELRQGQGGVGFDSYESTFCALDACPGDPLQEVRNILIQVLPPDSCPSLFWNVNPGLPSGRVGEAYSTTLTVGGGVAPFIWTEEQNCEGSCLPDGLTLNSANGMLSGTPTESGTFSIQVRVRDNCTFPSPQTITRVFTLTIDPANCAPLSLNRPLNLPPATVGEPYSFQASATGGVPPLTFATIADPGPLPDGLTMDTAGLISGTVTATPGTYQFTVAVNDSCVNGSQEDIEEVSLTVNPVSCLPVAILTTDLPEAVFEDQYEFQLEGTGEGLLTWEIIEGGLPADLTLSSDGLISGFVDETSGSFQFTVQLTDSCPAGAQQAEGEFTITIRQPCDPLAIDQATPPNATNDVPYSHQLNTSSPGVPPLFWAIENGQLPLGLDLSTDGLISGTPQDKAGSYEVTVLVTDSCPDGPQIDTFTFDLVLEDFTCPALQITTTGLPDIVIGQNYFFQFSASGGFGPLTWRLGKASDPLPDGISFSPGGELFGVVPDGSEPLEFQLEVEVTDQCPTGQQLDTFIELVNVRCVALGPMRGTPPVMLQNQEYEFQPTLDFPGVPPYFWEIDNKFGTGLPAGIDIDANTGRISGFPDASNGIYTFRVLVTDACDIQQTISGDFEVELVDCEPLGSLTNVPDTAINDFSYSWFPELTSGTPPLFWSINQDGDQLPEGLQLDEQTGEIFGTPFDIPDLYLLNLAVTDSCENGVVFENVPLELEAHPDCDTVQIVNTGFPDAILFGNYSERLFAIGGSGTYEWRLYRRSDPLPDGMFVEFDDKEGAWFLSGFPTNESQVDQQFTFTLEVIDWEGCDSGPIVDRETFTITLRIGT